MEILITSKPYMLLTSNEKEDSHFERPFIWTQLVKPFYSPFKSEFHLVVMKQRINRMCHHYPLFLFDYWVWVYIPWLLV